MNSLARKWKDVQANPGLYIASVLFAAVLCALADHDLSVRFQNWHNNWVRQGSVCMAITVVYLLFPKPSAVATQVIFGLSLVIVFVFNTLHQRAMPGLIIAATIIGLFLYCMAEAFEIAFTLLRTKELDRFEDKSGHMLSSMNKDYQLFYETREWLVIALVISLTFVSDFAHLELPYPPGQVFEQRWIRLVFSLLFTTVIVVWVAQSPGKALALRNPVLCMGYCRFLWKPLKFFGKLMESAQMFEPGSLLTGGMIRVMPKFNQRPDLHPSQQAFFNTALKRYGYALYLLADEIEIDNDGSAVLKEIGLFYIVGGERTNFSRWYDFDAPIVSKLDGTPDVKYDVTSFTVPGFREEMDENLTAALNSIVKGESNGDAKPVDFGLSSTAEFATTTTEKGSLPNLQRANLTIEAPNALPERVAEPGQAVAIRFEVTVKTERGAFHLPASPGKKNRTTDYYFRSFNFPCLRTEIHIQLKDKSTTMKFAALQPEASLLDSPHPIESTRIISKSQLKQLSFEVRYPVPGIKYKLSWQVWPD